jgi:6-phosphogluconolactonase (cycloisomerase 2 family)
MKPNNLQIAILVLAAILADGCGGGSVTPKPATNPIAACTASPKPEAFYVLNDGDNTVSMYTVDACSGVLTPTTPATVNTGGNAFGSEGMAVDPSGRFAYVANLGSNATDLATISMYTINSSTRVLTPTSPATVPTGFFPQGIAIDPSGKFVYTANSDDNTVSMFTINPTTGILTPTTPATVATGWSPLSVTVDPSGRFAYAANQDDGTVSMYTINSTTGILTPTVPASVSAGSSPFGVTLDPSSRFAYVPDAYSGPNNFVSEFTVDPTTGVLTPTAEMAVSAGESPTCVAVDPSGKFAYVVNRIGNSVSMFLIDSGTGDLQPNGTIATGTQPFQMVVDPLGKFAYVADESGAVSIYTLNSDGTLTSSGTATTGGIPVSLAVTGSKP